MFTSVRSALALSSSASRACVTIPCSSTPAIFRFSRSISRACCAREQQEQRKRRGEGWGARTRVVDDDDRWCDCTSRFVMIQYVDLRGGVFHLFEKSSRRFMSEPSVDPNSRFARFERMTATPHLAERVLEPLVAVKHVEPLVLVRRAEPRARGVLELLARRHADYRELCVELRRELRRAAVPAPSSTPSSFRCRRLRRDVDGSSSSFHHAVVVVVIVPKPRRNRYVVDGSSAPARR